MQSCFRSGRRRWRPQAVFTGKATAAVVNLRASLLTWGYGVGGSPVTFGFSMGQGPQPQVTIRATPLTYGLGDQARLVTFGYSLGISTPLKIKASPVTRGFGVNPRWATWGFTIAAPAPSSDAPRPFAESIFGGGLYSMLVTSLDDDVPPPDESPRTPRPYIGRQRPQPRPMHPLRLTGSKIPPPPPPVESEPRPRPMRPRPRPGPAPARRPILMRTLPAISQPLPPTSGTNPPRIVLGNPRPNPPVLRPTILHGYGTPTADVVRGVFPPWPRIVSADHSNPTRRTLVHKTTPPNRRRAGVVVVSQTRLPVVARQPLVLSTTTTPATPGFRPRPQTAVITARIAPRTAQAPVIAISTAVPRRQVQPRPVIVPTARQTPFARRPILVPRAIEGASQPIRPVPRILVNHPYTPATRMPLRALRAVAGVTGPATHDVQPFRRPRPPRPVIVRRTIRPRLHPFVLGGHIRSDGPLVRTEPQPRLAIIPQRRPAPGNYTPITRGFNPMAAVPGAPPLMPDLVAAAIDWMRHDPNLAAFGDAPDSLKYWSDLAAVDTDYPWVAFDEPEESETWDTLGVEAVGNLAAVVASPGKLQSRQLADLVSRSLDNAPLKFADGILLYFKRTSRKFKPVTEPGKNGSGSIWKRAIEFKYIIERRS